MFRLINFLSVSLFRGDCSGIDKSSAATCLLCSDVVKGDSSPTWLLNSRLRLHCSLCVCRDFRFMNFTIFSIEFVIFLLLFILLSFYTFFMHVPMTFTQGDFYFIKLIF